MSKSRLFQWLCGLGVAVCSFSDPARAQFNETFVSSTGLNTNTCVRTAPCQTFAAALSHTNPGGQIVVLDAADYGVVLIDRSVTIVNDTSGTATNTGAAFALGVGQ